jgi:hypothetical protein
LEPNTLAGSIGMTPDLTDALLAGVDTDAMLGFIGPSRWRW